MITRLAKSHGPRLRPPSPEVQMSKLRQLHQLTRQGVAGAGYRSHNALSTRHNGWRAQPDRQRLDPEPAAGRRTRHPLHGPSLTTQARNTWLNSLQIAAEGASNSLTSTPRRPSPHPGPLRSPAGAGTTFG